MGTTISLKPAQKPLAYSVALDLWIPATVFLTYLWLGFGLQLPSAPGFAFLLAAFLFAAFFAWRHPKAGFRVPHFAWLPTRVGTINDLPVKVWRCVYYIDSTENGYGLDLVYGIPDPPRGFIARREKELDPSGY